MGEYRVKRRGDVLYLGADLPSARSGFYVLLDSHADSAKLCLLGVEPETDMLVVTAVEVQVPIADLCCFEETGFGAVNLDDSGPVEIAIGDVLEPVTAGDPLPVGLYQVVEVDRNFKKTWPPGGLWHSRLIASYD